MADYSEGKIYLVKFRNDSSLVYVGSTKCPLNERFRKDKYRNTSLYKYIDENCDGNWDDWYIELYEDYPCLNEKELERREGEITLEFKNDNTYNCINKCIAGRTTKEYYEDNKEKINEYKKEYREQNKEKILEKAKEYYENNREKINEKAKEYYENNKEKILEYKKEYKKEYYKNNKEKILEKNKKYREQNKEKEKEYKKEYRENNKEKAKEYYENNKEKILEKNKEKFTCSCGVILTKNSLARHLKTKKHLASL